MAPPSRTSRTRAGGLRQAHRPGQGSHFNRMFNKFKYVNNSDSK